MKTSKIVFLALLVATLVLVIALFIRNQNKSSPQATPEVRPELAKELSVSEDESISTTPAPLVLREPVLELTGLSGDGALLARRVALEALPEDLNQKELDTIYTNILEYSRPEGYATRAWHAFFNDVLNALVLDQEKPVADLPDRLMAIVNDTARHRVIRDYALQHLLSFAEHRMKGSERVAVLDSAWAAISGTRDSFRGTYLVTLSYRAGEVGWPTDEDVSAKAWQVASSDDAHVLSRITALQVCGKLGHQEALPLALKIAADTKAHMTLRTSAIATVGDLGTMEERSFLSELAKSSPPRLLVAIEAALGRIKAKENPA
jgi:hypothetical protein